MQNNTFETLMGAVVILVAAGFLYFAYTSTSVGSLGGYELGARFASLVASGMVKVEAGFAVTHVTSTGDRLRVASGSACCGRHVVVDELIRGGVRDVVLCPGSRNAPLAFALQDHERDPNPAQNDNAADRPGRDNLRRLTRIRADWQRGRAARR